MLKPPSPLPSLRNGLKWRDGRPRWEPSPANRKFNIAGRDFRYPNGEWVADRGTAISLADARHKWAELFRRSHLETSDGNEARDTLRAVLEKLQPPAHPDARWRRAMVQDIIDSAHTYLAIRPTHDATQVPRSNRTISAMMDGYFANPPAGKAASTLKTYHKMRRFIDAKFGHMEVTEPTRGMIRRWYDEMIEERGLSAANLTTAALGAGFSWAMLEDWITESPCTKLQKGKPDGRIVIWSFAMERAFVEWCDTHGFEDVADAVMTGIYTGASQVDMCKLTLGHFGKKTWRFNRQKTGQEALVAWLPQVLERAERRRRAVHNDGVEYISLSVAPFLMRTGDARGPHTSQTIGVRYRMARTAMLSQMQAGLIPMMDELLDLNLADTRDTCVTRLFLSGIPIDRIPMWTGHSTKEAEKILRKHYLMLTEEGATEMAEQYEAYAARASLVLA